MSTSEHPSTNRLSKLWDRARAGSEESIGVLLETYRPYLLAIANASLNDDVRPKFAASDLVQETIVRAHTGFPEFQGTTDSDLQTWLRQILRNQLIDRVRFTTAARRDYRRETSLDDSATPKTDPNVPAPDDQVVRQEQYELLLDHVRHLTSREQYVVRAYHEQGLPFARIGEHLGCSANTARNIWFNALDQLARGMQE